MNMSADRAQSWVTVSALVVAGIYAYRRLIEPSQPGTLKNVVGVGELVPLGQFATAWGFTFLVIAIMAQVSPGLGGGMAILIATSDAMTNSASLFADVGKQSGQASAATTGTPTLSAAGVGQTPGLVNTPGGGTSIYKPPTKLNG